MSVPLLFIIGTGLSGLILILITLGFLIFFLCRLFMKKMFKSSPARMNRISILVTSGILILIIGAFTPWLLSYFRNLDLPSGEITFDQPQPEGRSKLDAVPEVLQGNYLSVSDSTYLTISKKEIILKAIQNLTYSRAELDSDSWYNLKDTIYYNGFESMSILIKNDSVYERSISFDTLNYPSEEYVLKEVNGYYFLNKSIGKKWIVRTLRIVSDELLLSLFRFKEEVDTLAHQGAAQSDPVHSASVTKEGEDFYTQGKIKAEIKFIKMKAELTN